MYFEVKKTDAFTEYLAKKNCIAVFLHPNMTDTFQPLEVSVNRNIKSMVRNCYNDWYSEQVVKALNNGTAPTDVNVEQPISIIKPLCAKWIIEAYNYLLSQPGAELIKKGFTAILLKTIENADEIYKMDDNPFL